MRKRLICPALSLAVACTLSVSGHAAQKTEVRLESLAGKSFMSRIIIRTTGRDTSRGKTTARISTVSFSNRLSFSKSPLPGLIRMELKFIAVAGEMQLGSDRLIFDSRHPERNSTKTKFPAGSLISASFRALVGQRLIYDLAPDAAVVRTIGLDSLLQAISSRVAAGPQGRIPPSGFRDTVSYSTLTRSLDESPRFLLLLPHKRVGVGDSWRVTEGVAGSRTPPLTTHVYAVRGLGANRITVAVKAYRKINSSEPGYAESMARTGTAQIDLQTGLTMVLKTDEHRRLGPGRGEPAGSSTSDSSVHRESTLQPVSSKRR